MIWFVVITVVVVALIVGPVMMMRPSPAQKNKENMRNIASASGIRFTIKKLPKQAAEIETPEPVPAYFFAPTDSQASDDWLLLRATYPHEVLYLRGWEWQGDVRATTAEQDVLKKHLPDLPEDVRGVSAGSRGIYVYWNEKGGEPVLEKVIALLQALKQLQAA